SDDITSVRAETACRSPPTNRVTTDWAFRLHRSVDMKRACLLAGLFLAAACSHPTQRASRVAAGADAAAGQAAFPKSPDVSREVMGWMVFADGARVLRELVPGGENADLKTLQTQTAASLGVDPVLG